MSATGSPLASWQGLFAGPDAVCELVPAPAIPEPYHKLLVHTHHMTVTVEEFYGSPVGVRILDLCMTDEWYARKILLITERDDRVVQFGMVRIQLRFLKPPVRAAVLSGDTPLGRVLIQHDVLRRVEPSGFLRVSPCDATRAWFGPAGDTTTFGRTGTIFCDGQPAIDVVEVLAPVGG